MIHPDDMPSASALAQDAYEARLLDPRSGFVHELAQVMRAGEGPNGERVPTPETLTNLERDALAAAGYDETGEELAS